MTSYCKIRSYYKLFISILIYITTTLNVFHAYGDKVFFNQHLIENQDTLIGGWYEWKPYQFKTDTINGHKLTGLDIDLTNSITKKIGIKIEYDEIDWIKHQKDLALGNIDIASGATYTDARAQYAYFSIPYRYEENSLFVLNDYDKTLNFNNIDDFLLQIRSQKFKIGVVKGYIYANSQINVFVSDAINDDIVIKYDNDREAIAALLNEEIDGMIAGRLVVAYELLQAGIAHQVHEISLNISTPVHFMLSKETVPLELVDKFNNVITEYVKSNEYYDIMKNYLYSIMLMQTVESYWFYLLGVIGTIAFAMSGIAYATKENATLFITLLFAMLPSIGGVILRDVIINRSQVGIFLTPYYIYYILAIVIFGFFILRILGYYNIDANKDRSMIHLWSQLILVGDTIGQACFIITGVTLIIMAKIEPLILWGPFLAFITAHGGCIIRDLLCKDRDVQNSIGGENTIIWALIFSVFLTMHAYNPYGPTIQKAVAIVVIGAIATKLLVHYYKISNIYINSK